MEIISRDGRVYYVIQADKNGIVGVQFLDTYSSLCAITEKDKQVGLFFVRDASGKRAGGDPSVRHGWAVYVRDFVNHKWIKMAEQESLDGGIDPESELLERFVTKEAFNVYKESVGESFATVNKNIKTLQNDLANLKTATAAIEAFINNHKELFTNVLEKLTAVNGILHFNGKPVSGCVYLYNERKADGSSLVWKDPTVEDPDEEVVQNSSVIAKKFAATAIATIGGQISIVELDGSVTTYDIIEKKEGSEVTKAVRFYKQATQTTNGVLQIVAELPEPNEKLFGHGLWSPIRTTKEYGAGHIYQCRKDETNDTYFWSDLKLESKVVIMEEGAKISICYTQDDLGLLWRENHIYWDEPEDANWDRTVLVRKVGSRPSHAKDGTVIGVFSDRSFGTAGVTDVVPFMTGQMYYGVFSFTKSDASFKVPEENDSRGMPELLGWGAIMNYIQQNLFGRLFSVNDLIVLPPNSVAGEIICKIKEIGDQSVTLISQNVVKKMAFKDGASDPVEYSNSDVHIWLNDELFYGFTETDRGRIGIDISIPDDGSEQKYYEDEKDPSEYWNDPTKTVSADEAKLVKGVVLKVTLTPKSN